jgi:xylulokinase
VYKRQHPDLILGYHVVPGKWLLQGGTTGGGGAVRWFDEQFGFEDHQKAEATGTSALKLMDDGISTIAPGSEGLTFLPYMAGERSPIWNDKAKGVFYGLDFSKTKAHMGRAVLEGVAYALRHNIEIAEAVGAGVKTLKATGGAANSKVWTQIKADISGKPIEVAGSGMETTLGAAILAGVGVGIYESFDEAVQKTIRIRQTYEPNAANKAVYDAGYERYRTLYETLKPMMR